MENTIRVVILIVGIFIGLFVYDKFLVPETDTKIEYVEKIQIDTVYKDWEQVASLTNIIDSLQRELNKPLPIQHKPIRDTVLVEGWKPVINQFSATFPFLYGNAYLSGEVMGEILKTDLAVDFKFPSVKATIEKTTTITNSEKPSGIYATGGISSEFQYSVGGTYLRNKSLIGYEYAPQLKVHSVRVGWKIF